MSTQIRPMATVESVERVSVVDELWTMLELAQEIADIKHEARREAQRDVRLLPVRKPIEEERTRLGQWLGIAYDDLGTLSPDVDVDDRERLWLKRLDRYEVLSIAIDMSTDVLVGLYRLPEVSR
jgi:hypothetical protein